MRSGWGFREDCILWAEHCYMLHGPNSLVSFFSVVSMQNVFISMWDYFCGKVPDQDKRTCIGVSFALTVCQHPTTPAAAACSEPSQTWLWIQYHHSISDSKLMNFKCFSKKIASKLEYLFLMLSFLNIWLGIFLLPEHIPPWVKPCWKVEIGEFTKMFPSGPFFYESHLNTLQCIQLQQNLSCALANFH